MGENYCSFEVDELEVFKVTKWKTSTKKKNNLE